MDTHPLKWKILTHPSSLPVEPLPPHRCSPPTFHGGRYGQEGEEVARESCDGVDGAPGAGGDADAPAQRVAAAPRGDHLLLVQVVVPVLLPADVGQDEDEGDVGRAAGRPDGTVGQHAHCRVAKEGGGGEKKK